MCSSGIIRVDEWKMREIFNKSGYLQDVGEGRIRAEVMRNKHPNWIAAWVPFCTYSQEISYRLVADGSEVARVHQYFRPDGTLGASGRPDPKRVMIGSTKYRLLTRTPNPERRWARPFRAAFWWSVNRILGWFFQWKKIKLSRKPEKS